MSHGIMKRIWYTLKLSVVKLVNLQILKTFFNIYIIQFYEMVNMAKIEQYLNNNDSTLKKVKNL